MSSGSPSPATRNVVEAVADSTTGGDDFDPLDAASARLADYLPSSEFSHEEMELNIFPEEEEGELFTDEGEYSEDDDEVLEPEKPKRKPAKRQKLIEAERTSGHRSIQRVAPYHAPSDGNRSNQHNSNSHFGHSRTQPHQHAPHSQTKFSHRLGPGHVRPRPLLKPVLNHPPVKHRLGISVPPVKQPLLQPPPFIPSLESVAPKLDPTLFAKQGSGGKPPQTSNRKVSPGPPRQLEPEWMKVKRSVMNESKDHRIKIVQQSTRELTTLPRAPKVPTRLVKESGSQGSRESYHPRKSTSREPGVPKAYSHRDQTVSRNYANFSNSVRHNSTGTRQNQRQASPRHIVGHSNRGYNSFGGQPPYPKPNYDVPPFERIHDMGKGNPQRKVTVQHNKPLFPESNHRFHNNSAPGSKNVKQVDYLNDRVINPPLLGPVPIQHPLKRANSVQNRLGSVPKSGSGQKKGPGKKDKPWKILSDSSDDESIDPNMIRRKSLKQSRRTISENLHIDVEPEIQEQDYMSPKVSVRSAVVLTDFTNKNGSRSKSGSPIVHSKVVTVDAPPRKAKVETSRDSSIAKDVSSDVLGEVKIEPENARIEVVRNSTDEKPPKDSDEPKEEEVPGATSTTVDEEPEEGEEVDVPDEKSAREVPKLEVNDRKPCVSIEPKQLSSVPIRCSPDERVEETRRRIRVSRSPGELKDSGDESDSSDSSSSSSSGSSSSSSSSVASRSSFKHSPVGGLKFGVTCTVSRKRQLSTEINPSSDSEDDYVRKLGGRLPLEPKCIASAKYKASLVNQASSNTLGEEVLSKKSTSKSGYDLYRREKTRLGIAKSPPKTSIKQTTNVGDDSSSCKGSPTSSSATDKAVAKASAEPLEVPKPWRKTESKSSDAQKQPLKKNSNPAVKVEAHSRAGHDRKEWKDSSSKSEQLASMSASVPSETEAKKAEKPAVSAKLSTVCNTYNVYQSPIAMSNQFVSPTSQPPSINEDLSTNPLIPRVDVSDDSGNQPFYQVTASPAVANGSGNSASNVKMEPSGQPKIHSDYDPNCYQPAASNPAPVVSVSIPHPAEHHNAHLAPQLVQGQMIHPCGDSALFPIHPPQLSFPGMVMPSWDPNGLPAPTNNDERVMMKYLPWCFNSGTSPSLSELNPYFARFWDSFNPRNNTDAKILRQVAVGLLESAIIFREGQGETVDLQLKIMLNLMKNLKNFE